MSLALIVLAVWFVSAWAFHHFAVNAGSPADEHWKTAAIFGAGPLLWLLLGWFTLTDEVWPAIRRAWSGTGRDRA